MTKLVPLSQHGKHRGKYFAIIDDQDFDRVNTRSWQAVGLYKGTPRYARSNNIVNMSNFILDLPNEVVIDHIDCNGFNNTRENLRPATRAQNQRNLNKRRDREYSSKYKGVYFSRTTHKWQVQIRENGKIKCLGSYVDECAAARAYDAEAIKLFGEFARLNFSKEDAK